MWLLFWCRTCICCIDFWSCCSSRETKECSQQMYICLLQIFSRNAWKVVTYFLFPPSVASKASDERSSLFWNMCQLPPLKFYIGSLFHQECAMVPPLSFHMLICLKYWSLTHVLNFVTSPWCLSLQYWFLPVSPPLKLSVESSLTCKVLLVSNCIASPTWRGCVHFVWKRAF